MNDKKTDAKNARDVRIKITGSHENGGEREVLVTNCEGTLYERDGKHFLRYTETDSDTGAKRDALIRIEGKTVTLSYRGNTETTMIFDVGTHTKSMYITPMGSMPIEIDTTGLDIDMTETSLNIRIEYKMSLSGGEARSSSIVINTY